MRLFERGAIHIHQQNLSPPPFAPQYDCIILPKVLSLVLPVLVKRVAHLEFGDGGVVPPVAHVADLVELPALVVEGVAQLVPHHHADRPVVDAPGVLWRICVRCDV